MLRRVHARNSAVAAWQRAEGELTIGRLDSKRLFASPAPPPRPQAHKEQQRRNLVARGIRKPRAQSVFMSPFQNVRGHAVLFRTAQR